MGQSKSGTRNGQLTGTSWRSLLLRPKMIAVMLLLAGLPFLQNASQKSQQNLREQPRFQLQRSSIQLTDRPEYVPADLLERVWLQADLPEQWSILEPGLAEKLGQALEVSPWVRRVKRLSLEHPLEVQIELEYRRPVALVRSELGFYPVDRDGILLPPMDFTEAQLPLYPLIDQVQTLPQGPAGTHWGDLAVWGAARLVDLLVPDGDLQRYWKKYDLVGVRVYGRADLDRSTAEHLQLISYRLLTRSGSEVIWGIAPGVPDPTEPNAETKLKRLELYHRDFGGLSSEHGPIEIDLRRWKDIARRPLELPSGNPVTR